LATLIRPFAIPILVFVTWRGEPGTHDEPQHALTGAITPSLLSLVEIEHADLPATHDAFALALDRARAFMNDTGRPFAFLVRKDCIAGLHRPTGRPHALEHRTARDLRSGGTPPSRIDAL